MLGIERIRFDYYSGKSSTSALEAFLHRNKWSPPSLTAKVYHIDRHIAEAPWLRNHPMPAGITVIHWTQLTSSQESELREQEGVLYPSFLSPFKTIAPLEKSNSVALEAEGRIVGWTITYRLSEDTVLYDAVFVTPQYQLSGLAFMLLSRSVTMQLDAGIPYGMFTVNVSTPFMLSIADRRLRPYAVKVSEKRAVYKILGS
jgi:GNAT superfamily N-acetyltransferase